MDLGLKDATAVIVGGSSGMGLPLLGVSRMTVRGWPWWAGRRDGIPT
jgi:hypothetical protein